MKEDQEGRRLCEYPYCRNYAESKGTRNGERRYRPWCEKHRHLKVPVKRHGASSKIPSKPTPKPKAKPKSKPKSNPKAKARTVRRPAKRSAK
jgi:hypothetical protein